MSISSRDLSAQLKDKLREILNYVKSARPSTLEQGIAFTADKRSADQLNERPVSGSAAPLPNPARRTSIRGMPHQPIHRPAGFANTGFTAPMEKAPATPSGHRPDQRRPFPQ
jgi:hypothetical protein